MPVNPAAVERIVDEFFRASADGRWDDARATMSPDATLWQSTAPVARTFDEALPGLRRMSTVMGRWEYDRVRRLTTTDGCCEQHVVRFVDVPGGPVELDVCVVIRVDESGLIRSLEEYLDGAPFTEALQRRRSARG